MRHACYGELRNQLSVRNEKCDHFTHHHSLSYDKTFTASNASRPVANVVQSNNLNNSATTTSSNINSNNNTVNRSVINTNGVSNWIQRTNSVTLSNANTSNSNRNNSSVLPLPSRSESSAGSSDNYVVCNCNAEALMLTVRKDGPNQGICAINISRRKRTNCFWWLFNYNRKKFLQVQGWRVQLLHVGYWWESTVHVDSGAE